MPAKDGTGPSGQGAKTGRGFGVCGGGLQGSRRFGGFRRGNGQYANNSNKSLNESNETSSLLQIIASGIDKILEIVQLKDKEKPELKK